MKITIEEIEKEIAELDELKKEHRKLKDEAAKIWANYERRGMELLDRMEDSDIDSYKGKAGTISKKVTYSVKTPKTKESKEKFFEYLKEKGGEELLYEYMTVDSRTLNSFYKAESEAAEEENNFDFSIPGLEEPEARFTFSLTKR